MAEQTMPDFEYISCLGHGCFGIVLKVKDPDKDSYSAVKLVFPGGKQDKNLKRECEMKGKSHQNVVKVFNFFETVFTNLSEFEKIDKILVDDNNVHDLIAPHRDRLRRKQDIPVVGLLMELCGPTLRDWLKQHVNHKMDDLNFQSTQLEIVKDMINGMQFLHDNKIIHRDFKPDNVMFSLSQEDNKFAFPLKIGDFGLCRILHSDESRSKALTSRLGTLDYMAPERSGNSYDFQSDIFSLGLVIWEVVQLIPFSGRRNLFNELVIFDRIELICNNLPIFTSMIINMTKKDSKSRTKTIKEVKDILSEISFTHSRSQLNELSDNFQKMKLNVSKDKASPIEFSSLQSSDWNVNEIVETLVKDDSLINGKRNFARSLYISENSLKELEDNYRKTNDIHSYFRDVLKTWKRVNGNEASVSTLLKILKENVFVAEADRLSKLPIGSSASVTKLQVKEPVSNFVGREKELKELNDFFMAKKSSSIKGGKGEKELLEILENNDAARLSKLPSGSLDSVTKLQVKDPVSNFVGRGKELKELNDFFMPRKSSSATGRNAEKELSEILKKTDINKLTRIEFIQLILIWKSAGLESEIVKKNSYFALKICQRLLDLSLYREMKEFSEISSQQFVRTLGPDHIDTLSMQFQLGRALGLNGECEEALVKLQVLWEKEKKILGEEHAETLQSAGQIASVYQSLKRFDESLEWHERVLKSKIKVHGENHHNTMTTKNNMAIVLNDQGKREEALTIYKQVLEWREKELGHEHPDTLSTRHNIATCLFGQGKFVEAKKEFEEVLELKVKVLGEEHAYTLNTKYWLSHTLYSLGQKEEALEMMEQVLISREKVLGLNHPHTNYSRDRISKWRKLH